MTTSTPASKKDLTNVCDLKVKFPTYVRDRDRHLISIIQECLDWRIAHGREDDGSTFNVRPSAVKKYMPYIKTQRDMAGVKKNIRNMFGTRKDHPEFHHYYQYKELSTIFEKQRRNINPLPDVEYQKELPFTNVMEDESPSIIVKDTTTSGRGNTTGDFMIEFGTRHVFKAPIMNESHYFECVKVFNEMYRSYI